jgi:hypothetical protein
MGEGIAFIVAAIIVGVLVFTKPNFFWNNAQRRRARQVMPDAEAEKITYAFLLGLIGLGLVLMAFG